MKLKDKVNFIGEFSIKSLDKNNNIIDEYTDKNLIMDAARANMASLISGGSTSSIITKLVLGSMGHVNGDILDNQEVGETDSSKPIGNQDFDSTRTALFSELIDGAANYKILFNTANKVANITVNGSGYRYEGSTLVGTEEKGITVKRLISERVVTYTFTIQTNNANSGDILNPIVVYTEAALYCGNNIFSMKTFPARVKEDTVKFIITWSIIF